MSTWDKEAQLHDWELFTGDRCKDIFADALEKNLLLQSHLQGKPPTRNHYKWAKQRENKSINLVLEV